MPEACVVRLTLEATASVPKPVTSPDAIASIALTCAGVSATGVAADPVLLPTIVLAVRAAIFDRPTAPAAIVRASDPATLVTSPVWAGSCAACNTPVTWVDRLTLDTVARLPRPETSVLAIARRS